jgi:glutamyl aminopeptidase
LEDCWTFFINFIAALEIEFPADMTWFKANINGTGFYRVNYPRGNWDALKDQMIADHNVFSALDRAQLIGDAFALSR